MAAKRRKFPSKAQLKKALKKLNQIEKTKKKLDLEIKEHKKQLLDLFEFRPYGN